MFHVCSHTAIASACMRRSTTTAPALPPQAELTCASSLCAGGAAPEHGAGGGDPGGAQPLSGAAARPRAAALPGAALPAEGPLQLLRPGHPQLHGVRRLPTPSVHAPGETRSKENGASASWRAPIVCQSIPAFLMQASKLQVLQAACWCSLARPCGLKGAEGCMANLQDP